MSFGNGLGGTVSACTLQAGHMQQVKEAMQLLLPGVGKAQGAGGLRHQRSLQ